MFDRFVRAPRPLAVLLLTALAACGDEEDGGRACDVGWGACAEYADADLSSMKAQCEQGGQRWVASCPTANLLGTCQVTTPEARVTVYAYLGVKGTAAEGEAECASLTGTWAAAPAIPQGAAVQATVACELVPSSSERVCLEYSGTLSPERQAGIRDACASGGGAPLSNGACPAATHGTCTLAPSASITLVERFYDASTAAEGQVFCARASGTWSNG